MPPASPVASMSDQIMEKVSNLNGLLSETASKYLGMNGNNNLKGTRFN